MQRTNSTYSSGSISYRRSQGILVRNTQSQYAQGTLIHWYQSHHNGDLHLALKTIHTEEPDNEFIIEEADWQYRWPFYICNPFARCYMQAKKIRAYRHFLQNSYEDVFRILRWIDLPGGQAQVAQERSYLMNYIWLICFIISEVDTNNKESARHIRLRLEDLLAHAENLGVLIQDFFRPLQKIATHHALVEEMGEQLQYRKISRPRVERKIFRLQIKPDNTMLTGNKVPEADFAKLLIYVRKDCQDWTRFKTLTDSDKVDIVTKGMTELADTLKDLRGLIKKPLRILMAGGGSFPYSLFLPKLVTHVQQMTNEVKNIISSTGNNLDGDDRSILEALMNEVEGHYGYVLKYGELMVEEIWDVILMVRLCYMYIRENPLNSINAASPDAVLQSKFRKGRIKKFLKSSKFMSDDFFKTDCPDTLRKLPVVVAPINAEISLHLQGHRNTHKSKISTPSHRFSTKKRSSGGKALSYPFREYASVKTEPSTTKPNMYY